MNVPEPWPPGAWQTETFARIHALGFEVIRLEFGVWTLAKPDGIEAGPFHTNQALMTWLAEQDGGHSRPPF